MPRPRLLSHDYRMENAVLFIQDLARVLRISRSTIDRRMAAGTFPIPPLPALDNRLRFAKTDVDAYLANRVNRPRTRNR